MPPMPQKKRPKPILLPAASTGLEVVLDDQIRVTVNGQEWAIKADELRKVKELGRGAYGVVETMMHKPSGLTLAVKRIHISLNDTERKRMRNEVTACKESVRCPYMVGFYGAMLREGDVWICMEVMDTSLDKLLGMASDLDVSIPEPILARIAYSILKGLSFMKEEINLMHRDVKPSNVLLNRSGEVKICDFGISGHLTNSVAKTIQAGCKPYMAPERINPQTAQDEEHMGFDVRSDVWSIGITMIELATGKHPYDKWKTPFEQLRQVVENDPPSLEPGQFSQDFEDFVSNCLRKDYKKRPKFKDLLIFPFIKRGETVSESDVSELACQVLSQVEEQQQASSFNLAQYQLSRGLSNLSLGRSDSPAEVRSRSGSGISLSSRQADASQERDVPDGAGVPGRAPSGVPGPLLGAFGDGGNSSGCSSADSSNMTAVPKFS